MEIAEQWQREWTGSAEYGKVMKQFNIQEFATLVEALC